jgi:putative ABC transport system permease protein
VFGIFGDIRYGIRRLSGSPGFTVAAVLTIALGVGLNAGAFSILNGLVLRDLPVPGGDALVVAYQSVGRSEKGAPDPRFTTAELETYRDRSETLVGLMGYSLPWPAALGGATPREILGRYVTCSYFDVLRQPPAAGRALTAQDCEPGAAPVVVLSHAFWSASYAADPSLVGSSILMNGQSFTVAGIAAADAHEPGLQRLDYYVPITAQPYLRPDRQWLVSDDLGWLEVMGRRKDDSTLEQVRAEFGVIAADIDAADPGRSTTVFVERATATSLRKLGRDSVSAGALVFLAFGLVLLIACANVANLFLARALTYTPAIAVRRALGASRGRIVRQLLIEALLIAATGGIVGSLAAVVSFEGLLSVLTASSPLVPPDAALDVRVLGFALALSLGTGIACGLWPALRVSSPDLHAVAKQGTAGAGGGRDGWLRSALIAAQVAACAVLLIGAGLLLRGLYATHTVDPGFPYRSVVYSSFELRGLGYERGAIEAFQRRLADEIGALPGVAAVGFAADAPLTGPNMTARVRLPGEDLAAGRVAGRNMVTPAYFSAAGIPIVRGRTFTVAEQVETSAVVIVTESTARSLWPDRDPVGQTLVRRAGTDDEARWEVVGVARDAHVAVIGQAEPYYVYEPIPPQFQHQLKLIVRSLTDASAIAAQVRGVVQALEPRLAFEVTPVEANIEAWQQRAALVTSLSFAVGLLALALAAVGIYGVVAFVVARRAHEIGVRMALGAGAARILRQILGQTLRPVVVGAVVGVGVAMALSTVLSGVLFGISPFDPIGIGGAVAFLLAAALLASLPAARRALRASPMTTIRYE